MCRMCWSRFPRAGKVKNQTPKVQKSDTKKKKTGRAKKRDQFCKKILSSSDTFNRTQSIPGKFSLHSKVPRFIGGSFESANSFRNWTHLLKHSTYENLALKHNKTFQRTYNSPNGSIVRVRSHTQKNKGSTGKSIQRDRNEASKIRMASVLYGEDSELEL